MSKVPDFQILVADNDSIFLQTCQTVLEEAGFFVLRATNPEDAITTLKNQRVHLAILDMRMKQDTDEKDKSGLIIAKKTSHLIPKIILTKMPTYQDVVELLKQDLQGHQAAVEFLDKRSTEPAQLIEAVNETLAQYVKIHWELVIHWQPHNTFLNFVNCLTPHLPDPQLAGRSAELEDLFRTLFRPFAQITIGQIITQHNGRLILPIFAFDKEGVETRYIVSFGKQTAVLAENDRYQNRIPDRLSIKNLGALNTSSTINFAATAYTFMGSDLEAAATIRQLFRKRAIENLLPAIDHLYQTNLGGWYETGRKQNEEDDLHSFYREWLGLDTLIPSMNHLQALLPSLAERALAANLLELSVDNQQLTFRLKRDEADYRFPNPITFFAKNRLPKSQRAHWGVTHGRINGDTVVIDGQDHAWLIDFAQVRRAPLLIDFVSLETAVKYDLFAHRAFSQRLAIEIKLNQVSNLQDEISLDNLEPDAINAVWVIEKVRQNAAALAGCDWEAYQQAMFFCAIARIATFNPETFYTQRKVAAYVHALLSAAMLAQHWQTNESGMLPEGAKKGIWLDLHNKNVWVEARPVELTNQEFRILHYLYQNQGQLCYYADILQEGLEKPMDEDVDHQLNRMHTAVSRLRRKVEPDARAPRYLFTVHGRGYRLFVTPQFK